MSRMGFASGAIAGVVTFVVAFVVGTSVVVVTVNQQIRYPLINSY
jgi:hypothetical protein